MSTPEGRFRLAVAATTLPVLLHGVLVMRVFDGLYGQDPYAYLAYALGPLRSWLSNGGPLPPFHWPPGYPLLVAIASLVLGPVARAGQLVALLTAAAVAPATATIARGLGLDRRPALLAACAVALTGQLWQSSVVVMSDAPALAALTWGAAGVVWWSREEATGRHWRLLRGAAPLGFSILCRWAAALAVAPLIGLATAAAARRSWGRGPALLLAAGLIGGAVLTPVLAPALDALRGRPRAGPSFTVDLAAAGWRNAHITSRRLTDENGAQEYPLPNIAFYGLAPARRAMLSPLGALLLLPGLATALRRPRCDRLLVLIGWPAVVFGYLVGMSYQNFRFVLTALPPLAIVAAIGADRLLPARRRWARWCAAAAVIGAACWMTSGGAILTRFFVVRADATAEVVARVAASVPADARVLAFGITLALEHDGRVAVAELYDQNSASLAQLLAEPAPSYLIADVDNLRRQWHDRPPGDALAWLEQHARLEPLWSLHDRTLVAVQRETGQ